MFWALTVGFPLIHQKENILNKTFQKLSTSFDIRNNKLSCYLCIICNFPVSTGNPQEKPHLRTYSPQQNHMVSKVKITAKAAGIHLKYNKTKSPTLQHYFIYSYFYCIININKNNTQKHTIKIYKYFKKYKKNILM